MDINAFLTAESLQRHNGSSNSQNGLFTAAPGANFIDLIISNIEEGEVLPANVSVSDKKDLMQQISDQLNMVIANAEEEGVDIEVALDELATGINEKTGLELTVQDLLAIANQEDLAAELANAQFMQSEAQLTALIKLIGGLSDQANNSGALAASEKASTFQDFVNHLLQGIPASSRPEVLKISSEDVQNALQDLAFDPNAQDAVPALIATDLSPEEINKLIMDIREQTEDGKSLVIGMVKLNPAEEQPVFVPAAILMPQQRLQQMAELDQKLAANDQDMDVLASQLNDLVVGAGDAPTPVHQTANPTAANPMTSGSQQTLGDMLKMMQQEGQNSLGTGTNFDGELGTTSGSDLDGANADIPAGDMKASKAGANPTVNISSLNIGEIGLDMMSFSDFLNGSMDLFQNGGATPSATISGPGSLAGLITQVQHSSMAHPSTHLFAATLSKAAASGDTQNITINMSPPELGRVLVQLEFSENSKQVKTHITVERAETYALLQRDAHLLERIFQDSGVDMAATDLSFELSEDGSLFDQNPDGSGQNDSGGSGGSGDAAEEELEIIETTMNWHVDPRTGLTHYNLLV